MDQIQTKNILLRLLESIFPPKQLPPEVQAVIESEKPEKMIAPNTVNR